MTNVLALDLGASSGRAIVGNFKDGVISLNEVHRFNNIPTFDDQRMNWNIDELFKQIKMGIKKSQVDKKIDSLGIDTWGVDFGLLDERNNLIEPPTHYRDVNTKNILERISKLISLQELYEYTGNQIMEINTLFQLLSIKENRPELFYKARKLLLMSDLFNYFLTGEMVAERSIASTTQLMDPHSKEWSERIIDNFNLPRQLFPKLVADGNVLGPIKKELGLGEVKVINVCQHDTASAVLSIPAEDPFLFISCGTWSLVGTELNHPVLNQRAREYNLTNETGFGKTTELLKNCTGLWIVQELKRNYQEAGIHYSYEEIAALASDITDPVCRIETDDANFMEPGDMRVKIAEFAMETGQKIPKHPGEFFKCAYESLAYKYKTVIQELEDTTEINYPEIHIVGGGSKSKYFCQLVANVTQKQVLAGPGEATAIGNILAQLISLGEIKDIHDARKVVKNSIEIVKYEPI